VIVAGRDGLSDFAALQEELGAGRSERLSYYAFDLLYVDGYDLRQSALLARKETLKQILSGASKRFLYGDYLLEDGPTVQARGCEMHIEGVVSKLKDSRYRSGRNETWIKSLCKKRETFPVVGFVPATAGSIAALYLGRREGPGLVYAGKAGTGFTGETARALRQRLDPIAVRKSPLSKPVKKPRATWVSPELLVDVEYRAMTDDGRLRHGSFKGVREDLETPRPELPQPAARNRHPPKAIARHIQRLLANAVVPSKDELRAYFRKAGKDALKYVGNRPLTLVRHVNGFTFYHTGPLPAFHSAVHALTFEKREGGEGTRAYVVSLQGLIGLANMDVVEIHPWNATADDIGHPDVMVFDLDPGEGVSWESVTESALRLRDLLRQESFEPWPKATGGKGLHVMAPLDASRDHDQIRELSKRLAARFAAIDRKRYTISSKLSDRPRKIFIDYFRNGRGQTAIGAYSPRARQNFPIAVPLTWSEVERGVPSDAYTMNRLP
jgi:bifunctional non-homologous end joining protein LigD